MVLLGLNLKYHCEDLCVIAIRIQTINACCVATPVLSGQQIYFEAGEHQAILCHNIVCMYYYSNTE